MEESNGKMDTLIKYKNAAMFLTAIIIAIIGIFLIVAIFTSKNTGTIVYNGESNGIKYSTNMKDNSDVIVVMKNETGRTVSSLKLRITYFDNDGNEISKKTSTTNVYLKNGEVSLNSVSSDFIGKSKIKTYSTEIECEYYEGEDKPSNYEKVDIENLREEENSVFATIKNKTNKNLEDICFYAVFFKNGLPVGLYANDVYKIEKEKEIEFSKPKNQDGNKVEFDFYKVFIKY